MFKKIMVISLLVGSIVLAGCVQQKWLSQDELFEKKKECANYQNEMKQSMKNYISKSTLWQDIDEDIKNKKIRLYLRDVFYSKKTNSCLYAFNKAEDKMQDIESYIEITYYIVDYLNNNLLYKTSQTCLNNNTCDIEQEFKLKLVEFK